MAEQFLRVFIGFDADETVAFHTLSQSILAHSSVPTAIIPLVRPQLAGAYTRARGRLESTDFSMTRFLVPYLCGYQGWALFMDCDMLMRGDVADLWALRRDEFAVMCVKHQYVPKDETKFLGNAQSQYEKKNWSSVMLMNTDRCRSLTVEYVNTASGLELHQFKWLESDDLIGSLPPEWNYLVGEGESMDDPELVHFTLGGPYFKGFEDCDFADEWRGMLAMINYRRMHA